MPITKFRTDDPADSISSNQLLGINRLVGLTLVIEGKIISHYKQFYLTQNTGEHHYFELTLDHDVLGEAENHGLEATDKFMGKRLTVVQRYKDLDDSPERTFVGVITKVGYLQQNSNLGNIVLKGFSPTILLDGAPHTQSFGGDGPVNMGIIADKVIKQGIKKSKYDIRVDGNDRSEIPFSVQYNETHYNYLSRMAEAYGEQFYYDGEVLHFGKLPPKNKAIQLIYGSNVSDIQVDMNAVHRKPEFYGYNAGKDLKLTSGDTPVRHISDIAKRAYDKNNEIYQTRALQVAPIKAATDKDVVYSQTGAAGSQGVEVFKVEGKTSIPFLFPGCVADLKMRKPDSNQTSYFTRVMITETTHKVDARGNYEGTFKAVASDTPHLPKPKFTMPVAQTQLAKVISNTDPKGQGRVQVRFDWQLHDTTDFIRMMSPDAGGTDRVGQNRGFVAIPEVGDQVMVGFEHNHPDMPFVMGGMFHGGNGLGGGANNRVKSLMTRSGHKLIFTEDESIVLTDKSGNEIHLDTEGSNITITAPETMTLNAKNMNINVGKNLNTQVGDNAMTSIGGNHTESVGKNKSQSVGQNASENVGAMKISSVMGSASLFVTGKLTEVIDGDVHSETKGGRQEVSEGDATYQSQENINSHAKKNVSSNSGEKGTNH